ncbi:MAG: MATE family efflux transporter [Ruminococcaceae bacterium]|nr:MATE family efflux transporter [Oscillospiraceae bacterium]
MEQVKDTSFRKKLISLILPMTLQNLVFALVPISDAVMLLYLSPEAMTSVSLSAQVPFVLSLFIYSITAGGSILAAQYWGKGDTESIEKIFGYMFALSLPIMIVFFSTTMIVPEYVIRIFTDKEVFITGAIPYLRCASFSYVFMTLAMIYETLLKNVGFVKQCTIASIVIVFLNIFLNAVFIFGLFGAPEMGISGAALATSISNGTGFIICLIFNLKLTKFRLRFKNIFRVDLDLRKRFSKYTLPYTLNQLLWGFGFAMITVILGRLEEDVAMANSIATIIKDLVSCLCYAIASGSVIVIGNELGANRLDKAKLYGDKLFKIGVISGIILGIVAAASSPLVIKFVNLSEKAEHYLLIMLLMCSYYILGRSINSILIGGIFSAGGDTKFGFICDTLTMWAFIVPFGFLAYKLDWPPMVVYFILNLDEIIKIPAVIIHYRKYKWVKNIIDEEV